MAPVVRTVIDLDGNSIALALAGEHDAHLKILEQRLDCKLTLRGNVLILEGPDDAVGKARAALDDNGLAGVDGIALAKAKLSDEPGVPPAPATDGTPPAAPGSSPAGITTFSRSFQADNLAELLQLLPMTHVPTGRLLTMVPLEK